MTNIQQDTETAILIGQAKGAVQFGSKRFLAAFQSVPQDKLNWSPAPTSRSALQIAGHVCGVCDRLAGAYRGQSPPADAVPREETLSDRAEAVQWLEFGTQALLAGLDRMTPERVASEMPTPFGIMPMRQMMMIAGMHFALHAGQLDYLQTMWGDMETHF